MNWEQLLELAEMLARPPERGETRGRPQQTHLRKAISAAYYAMFHSLANSNADTLVGSAPSIQNSTEWTRTQRALNHGAARTQMVKNEMAAFDPAIQDFGNTFLSLQPNRHEADYNPNPPAPFKRSEITRHIQRAREAIEKFQLVSTQERRRFATYILFGQRTRANT